jgi:hypothetical protein
VHCRSDRRCRATATRIAARLVISAGAIMSHQLQLFDRKTKRYVPVELANPDADTARIIANGKPWRICKPDRDLKKHYTSPCRNTKTRTAQTIRDQYVQWALDNLLRSITAFDGDYIPHEHLFTFVKKVKVEDYFTVVCEEVQS